MNEKPTMLSIRQVARKGILSENALRKLLKAGKLPAIRIGRKYMVNYDLLCEQLSNISGNINKPEGKEG